MHSIQRESLYQRFGFEIMPDGVAMQICNSGKKIKQWHLSQKTDATAVYAITCFHSFCERQR